MRAEQILKELDALQEQLVIATDVRDRLAQARLHPRETQTWYMINIGLRIRSLQEELKRIGIEVPGQGSDDLPPHICISLQRLGFLAHRLPRQEELKEAYRKLAKITHPDAGGDAEEMKKINKAYEIVSKWRQEVTA